MIKTLLVCLLAPMAMSAATITINVYAALGPSPYGDSPSYGTTYPDPGTYADTVQNALIGGGSDSGDINTTPTAFNKVTSVNASEILYSPNGDPLWRGALNPTGNFSNEVGTFLFFPFSITSTGGTFAMSDVTFSQHFSVPALDAAYGIDYVYGDNHAPDPEPAYTFEEMGFDGTNYLTGGEDKTTAVQGFYNTGGYYAFAYDMTANGGATAADQLANTLAAIAQYGSYVVTTCVSVGTQATSCADVTVTAPPSTVPEPASFALIGAGLLGLVALRRKRA